MDIYGHKDTHRHKVRHIKTHLNTQKTHIDAHRHT